VLGALLLGPSRRMQRVGEQEQARDQIWLFSTKHARLASTIRMAGQADTAGGLLFHFCDCIFQAGPIAGCITGSGRPEGPHLPVRQIATQDCDSRSREGFCQGTKQRGLSIATRTVGQD